MAVLDGEGYELITSVGPEGNVGCPVTPPEVEHFVDMIRQSSDATEEELIAIEDAATANAEQYR